MGNGFSQVGDRGCENLRGDGPSELVGVKKPGEGQKMADEQKKNKQK